MGQCSLCYRTVSKLLCDVAHAALGQWPNCYGTVSELIWDSVQSVVDLSYMLSDSIHDIIAQFPSYY